MDVHRKRCQVVVVGEDGRVQLADGLCRPRHRASMYPPYELGVRPNMNSMPLTCDLPEARPILQRFAWSEHDHLCPRETALALFLAFLPGPMTGSLASCSTSAAIHRPRSQLSCRRRGAPMVSGSTSDESQTFQLSRHQLFSCFSGTAPAQEGSAPQRPDVAKASSRRPQTSLITEPEIAGKRARAMRPERPERLYAHAEAATQTSHDRHA